MGIAPHCERLKHVHNDFMKAIKNAAPLHERFNNVHHGFMKALKMRIAFLVFQKFASGLKNFIQKGISFVGTLEQCASPFYAAPENVHLLIYESFNNLHRDLCRS